MGENRPVPAWDKLPIIWHGMAIVLLLAGIPIIAFSQKADSLNTARKCAYMKEQEREMIYEINLMRTHPLVYAAILKPECDRAKVLLDSLGRGYPDTCYVYSYKGDQEKGERVRTVEKIVYYSGEERYNALNTLTAELKSMKPLPALKPDKGIYEAAKLYAKDQEEHQWKLLHMGSDGSWPWERITRCSPGMETGNENLAGNSGRASARDIVMQLLIDEGIRDYGHRENLLNPTWTHVACFYGGFSAGMHQWIQEFGKAKKVSGPQKAPTKKGSK